MWNAGLRITPHQDSDQGVVTKLKSAGWQIPKQSHNGSVEARGQFGTLREFLDALHAADEAPADVQPVELMNIVRPEPVVEGHWSSVGDIFNNRNRDNEAEKGSEETRPSPETPNPVLPQLPAAVWTSMNEEDRSKAAFLLVESWTAFMTDRKEKAAWSPSREVTLLAQLDDEARSAATQTMLTRVNEEAEQRVRLMTEAVGMSKAITTQFAAWTKLASKVPNLLVLSIILSSIFIAAGLYLVSQQKLNGLEIALLAFVLTLMAISPATLLLIGRPLAGLDAWTPDAMFKPKDEPKKKETPEEALTPDKPVEPSKDTAGADPAKISTA